MYSGNGFAVNDEVYVSEIVWSLFCAYFYPIISYYFRDRDEIRGKEFTISVVRKCVTLGLMEAEKVCSWSKY
jgi:hypothetical protein